MSVRYVTISVPVYEPEEQAGHQADKYSGRIPVNVQAQCYGQAARGLNLFLAGVRGEHGRYDGGEPKMAEAVRGLLARIAEAVEAEAEQADRPRKPNPSRQKAAVA